MSTNTRSSLLIAARNAVLSVSALVASNTLAMPFELSIQDKPCSKIASSIASSKMNSPINPLPNYDTKSDDHSDEELVEMIHDLIGIGHRVYSRLLVGVKEFPLKRKQSEKLIEIRKDFIKGYEIFAEIANDLKNGIKEVPKGDELYISIMHDLLDAKSIYRDVVSIIDQIMSVPTKIIGELSDDDLLLISENAKEIALRNA